MTSLDQALVAERNQEAWVRVKSSMPGHQVFDEPFAFWTIPSRPAGVLQATRLRFSEDPIEMVVQLGNILRTYQEANSPANWFWGPSATPADLGKRFRKLHFMGPRYLPGMNRNLRDAIPKPEHPTEVVVDWDEFDVLTHPLVSFHTKASKPDVMPLLRELAAIEPRCVYPLVARIGSVAACSATVFHFEDSIGIYDVVTLPELRGQGAAKSVLRACLQLGRELGASFATLQSYPKANALYDSHDFVQVCRFTSMYYSRTRMEADRLRT